MHTFTYKQTEIGEIPEEWNVLEINQIGVVTTGKTPPTANKTYWNGSYPFVTPSDIGGYDIKKNYKTERYLSNEWLKKSEKNLISRGSTCFVCIGSTIGKVCYLKENSFTNQQINSVSPFENFDRDYVYYLLRANQDLIKAVYGGGGAAKNIINKSSFESIKLAAPAFSEQQQIAPILSFLDDNIELNRRMNKTLEEMGKTLFKRWFVDFEFPNENGKPYKLTGGEIVDSELGGIPKDWQVKELGDVLEINTKSLNPTRNQNDWFWHFSIPSYDQSDFPMLESGVMIKSNKTQIKDKSILVSKLNPKQERRIWSVDVTLWDKQAISSTEFINFVPSKEDWAFANFLFRNDGFYLRFANMSTGSTGSRQRVRPTEAAKLKIVYPEKNVRISFNKLAQQFLTKINTNLNEIRTLMSVRDLLLPRLISGKLRIYGNN